MSGNGHYRREGAPPRTFHVQELHQAKFYAGLLEGRITEALNQSLLGELLARPSPLRGGIGRPHLVQPTPRGIWRGSQEEGPPVHLMYPVVVCFATIDSERVEDPEASGSTLQLIWFQETFGLPSEGPLEDILHSLPWGDLATDYHV